MRRVGTLLAVEVALAVAPRAGRLAPPPSFGRKLLCDAHASISVPSTVKCSSDSRSRRRACASTAPRNLAATSPSGSRSRFPPVRLRRPKDMLGENGHVPHRRIHRQAHEPAEQQVRSEEHTSELPSLMRTTYPVYCCKKKNT